MDQAAPAVLPLGYLAVPGMVEPDSEYVLQEAAP